MKEPMSLTILDIATIIAKAEEMGVAVGFQMTRINKNKPVNDENDNKETEERNNG